MKRSTSWTPQELADFINWHDSVISQYPDRDVIINGHIHNTQRELRQDRIKFLGSVKVGVK